MDIDCVVIGAGPAGLSASEALTAAGVEHVVLERGQVGETWRTQRWDSLRVNSPWWFNNALHGQDTDDYLTAAEVVRRLEDLAADAPIRTSVAVRRLEPAVDGFELTTSTGSLQTRAVVVASGDQNVPTVPAWSAQLPSSVRQIHACEYRSPGDLPPGGVLVVGSGQSGTQIAEDLLAGGRQVVVSTSRVGRIPTRRRGHDGLRELYDVGFFRQTPEDLPDPSMMKGAIPLLSPYGRPVSLGRLAANGARLAGRVTSADQGRLTFDDSVETNADFGEEVAGRLNEIVDKALQAKGIHDSVIDGEQEPAVAGPGLGHLDLLRDDIGSVIWCTGLIGDFSWLPPSLRDADGAPRHTGIAGAAPGLWFTGIRWLTCRGSATLCGMPWDTATIASAAAEHLTSIRTASVRTTVQPI
ncbi:flavin-containing monooxygenase [Luteipulveratus mongoliensis]|uniref:flavin-containing monooxygenase n=1 Tax=Luteipulveratus mongoliensis TaxID=571913 RepID=UPI000698C494|nr:NAD(P)/FAD-dependent oxidoreductase [Luteipulveratus mongoliensis]